MKRDPRWPGAAQGGEPYQPDLNRLTAADASGKEHVEGCCTNRKASAPGNIAETVNYTTNNSNTQHAISPCANKQDGSWKYRHRENGWVAGK
jgi:hypothetical protein